LLYRLKNQGTVV